MIYIHNYCKCHMTLSSISLGIWNLLFGGLSTESLCKLPDGRGGPSAVFDGLGPLFKDDPKDDNIFITIHIFF